VADSSQIKDDMAENYLVELKSEYTKNLDDKSSLDNKASGTITVSITSITLLLTITTFLTDKIKPSVLQIFFPTFAILLILIIGTAIVAIILSIMAYKVTSYNYITKYMPFFDTNGNYRKK
jgi:uncharacterized integral membrane protein